MQKKKSQITWGRGCEKEYSLYAYDNDEKDELIW
jgi:hypothetical protein